MERTDILIEGGTVITMDPERRVLENHSVAIRDARRDQSNVASEDAGAGL